MELDKVCYEAYLSGMSVQDAFPHLNPVEREFLITGYCPDCQKLLFGNGVSDRIVEVL